MLDDQVLDVVLVASGIVAIVVAIVWRAGSRRREIGRSARLLRSTNPGQRTEAAVALTELGLDRSARVLLDHARKETDADVRVAIAVAVARRQWEPAGPPGVSPLREWAASELAAHGYNVTNFGPATTRLADMGGPRLPQTEPLPPRGVEGQDGAIAAGREAPEVPEAQGGAA